MLSASEVASAGLTATVTEPTASCGLITAPTSWPTMSVCAGSNVAGPPNENDGAAPATLLTMTTPIAPASAALSTLTLIAHVPRSMNATRPSKKPAGYATQPSRSAAVAPYLSVPAKPVVIGAQSTVLVFL